MRPKTILMLTACVALAGLIGYVAMSGDQDRRDIEELSRRATRRQATAKEKEAADLDALAAEGKGQPVPDHLLVSASPVGAHWAVVEANSQTGVELPFAPGATRTPPPDLKPLRENPGFVGADACQKCHQEKHASYIQTAHFRTMLPATAETVRGSVEQGKNRMATEHPDVYFEMLQRDQQVLQRVSFHRWQFEVPMDLITGSSKLAQTYLYWHGDRLFQSNVTYLETIGDWINSPGYVDADAAYARPIPVRCLECHTTYVELREPPNHYTPDSLILGISCERCHGPGKEHIDYHESNPGEKKSRFMSVPSKLSRQQQMDICGQCHNGATVLKGDAFQFRPGDALSDHYGPSPNKGEANSVHTSNQTKRLMESECFQQSEMGCVECHDPHRNERGNMALFSQRCLKCHESEHCGISEQLDETIADNCVDCHMPKRASAKHLRMESSSGSVFPPLRDHHIRVDQQATAEYLKSMGDTGVLRQN